MDQKEIDIRKSKIRGTQSYHRNKIQQLEEEYNQLTHLEMKLDDPHAVIPKSKKSIEDWLVGHPFPDSVLSMIFANYHQAFEVWICCNTYQSDFYIVKCNKKEEYKI